MKVREFAGLGVLLTIGLVIGAFSFWPSPDPDPNPPNPSNMTVTGIGGGKGPFLENPEVVRIMKDTYGLTVNFRRVGSLDQVEECKAGLDYCWPSSQTAGELIVQGMGAGAVKSEIIFNSPIVMYTWTPIADALIAQSLVQQTGDTYDLVDFPRLIQMINDGVQWSAIGLPQLYGKVFVLSSDPTQSNTGNSFAGLLGNTLNGGQVVDEASVEAVLPQLQTIFSKLGLLPNTTTQLFEQFLTLGIGAAPIIVAYESNLIEYSLVHQSPTEQAALRAQVRTLYPKPTVWSSHPLIALTPGGERFMEALRDPEIQRIGWEHHGFRSGLPGVQNDPAAVKLAGIPAIIDSVIQMPNPSVMTRIIEALQAPTTAAIKHEEMSV